MKEYSITMTFSIEANNSIDIDEINEFADDLSDTIKNESTKSIKIVEIEIDEIEDLNEDDLYDIDDDDE